MFHLSLPSQVIIIAHASASKMVHLQCHEKERGFLNAEGKREPFSSIHDPPTKELSVVVPSYNEELRCECVFMLSLYFYSI